MRRDTIIDATLKTGLGMLKLGEEATKMGHV